MTRRLLVAALGLAAALGFGSVGGGGARAAAGPPPVKHVFVIVLENKDYAVTFGANSPAPYLAKTLTTKGQLLDQYYGIGHFSLDNYIAMLSGQAPNIETQADCQIFAEFLPGAPGPGGQSIGQGCVYPTSVKTLADQFAAKGLTWKGYMEDMGTPCRHPTVNTQDTTQTAKPNDQYAARHNPFVYFHSIIDSATCAHNVVDLQNMAADLTLEGTTANFSFVTPDLCSDGHDAPCIDGRPGGLKSVDAFLSTWVPRILNSPAYKKDGLLLVMFDEAEVNNDATACCNEQPGPNSPMPGQSGPGGGRTGAVAISRFVKPGSKNSTPYNHYSFLRSMEDVFGLEHLGFAGQAGLKAFGSDVFSIPPSATTTATTTGPATATTLPETLSPR
jgi:hypothetical protein